MGLTNIDLEAAHVLAIELSLGIFGVTFIIELDETVGALFDRYIWGEVRSGGGGEMEEATTEDFKELARNMRLCRTAPKRGASGRRLNQDLSFAMLLA